MKRDAPQASPPGYILIDAWRAEAELFDKAGKPVSAQRLRRLADKAEAEVRRHHQTLSR